MNKVYVSAPKIKMIKERDRRQAQLEIMRRD